MNGLEKKNIFVKKSNLKHDYKYNYDKFIYVDSKTKGEIICPIHGSFWQTPQAHVRGNECPFCANNKRGKKDSIDQFIEKANVVHNNKYNYSKVEYVNAQTKVCIICPEHGEFWQTPQAHINGQGCPKCANRGMSLNEIIEQAKKIHNNKYDYSKLNVKNKQEKGEIICPIHGSFWQTLSKHLYGRGCPKCGITTRSISKTFTKEKFILKAITIFDDKDDFTNFTYEKMNKKAKFSCKIHGEYEMRPYDYLQGHRCPICGNVESKPENDIKEFCQSFLGEENVQSRNKIVLKGKELDIYIPSKKFAIEYNGLRWHSEEFGKDRYYHLSKTDECKKQGVKLIQIFEDEYLNHKEIVMNKIAHIIGVQTDLPKIMGRKCAIKEIKRKEAKEFLDTYHIQSSGQGKFYLGAYYEDQLIAVMSFKEDTNGSNKWELTRFASDYHYICQGIGGKLFKYFIRKYSPNEVKSFADRRWTIDEENNIYKQLGFEFEYYTKPEYRYIDGTNIERYHKFGFRKDSLMKKYGEKFELTIDMTESQMVEKIGFKKIWDCGLIKYIWRQK